MGENEGIKREFTGVWIPRYIIEDESLKPVDRLVYAEIACFKVCTMSNATLGNRAGCSEDTVSRSITRLKKNGYIVLTGFNGRVRKLQSQDVPPTQIAEAAYAETGRLPTQNAVQDNNIDNKEITTFTNVNGLKPEKPFGNDEINQAFDYWSEIVGYPITGNTQKNRYACNNLLKKVSLEGIKRLIHAAAASNASEYSPRIADFVEMQSKINSLLAWAKGQEAKVNSNERAIVI